MPLLPRTAVRRARPDGAPGHDPAGVLLGNELDRGAPSTPLYLPLDLLTRHGTVVGQTGMGKSTTLQSLLVRLWREHRVPFWVIEPTGNEYRSMVHIEDIEATVVEERRKQDRHNAFDPIRCHEAPSTCNASPRSFEAWSYVETFPVFSERRVESRRPPANRVRRPSCWEQSLPPNSHDIDGIIPTV